MPSDTAILYYSSNREKPAFEQRVQQNILRVCGGLPIISVTQKPMAFGHNICVGDVGASGFNCMRQILMAAEAATTRFVVSAESDCAYPPDYFEWTPPRDDVCYRDSNLYVMPDARDFFFHKPEGATHAQVIGREFYIDTLRRLFEGAPQWSVDEMNFPRERHHQVDIVRRVEHYRTENPVVQIKTHRGLRYYTRSERIPIATLPYWGDGPAFRALWLHGKVLA